MSNQLQENDKFQMQREISQYEHCIRIKVDLLAKDINVKEVIKERNFNPKQIHLYQHHSPFVICSSASISNTLLNDGYNLSFFKRLYA